MNAAPKPIRPARKRETYLIEHCKSIELDAATVDQNRGNVVCECGAQLCIRWKAERAA
jgi:hypothetical protein